MRLKPSQVVGSPFLAWTGISLYLSIFVSSQYAPYLILPMIALSVIFVMSPQIDWWWYSRNPPDTPTHITRFLENIAYYKPLNPALRLRFRQRVALYMLGNQFMRPAPPNEDQRTRNDVPEDIKAIIAATAVQLTFGVTDFMLSKFENIVIYPNAFPSPQYPDRLHFSEVYEADGVILFAADALFQGLTQPNVFNVGLYEYAKVYQLQHLKTHPIQWEADIWDKLSFIGGMTELDLQRSLNLPDISLFGVAVHHFFKLPALFQQVLPELYQLLEKLLRQNPMNTHTPIEM